MIFFTFGTEKFRFDRLSAIISEVISNTEFNKEEIVIQYGFSDKLEYSNGVISFDFCSREQFTNYVKKSDFFITHGGVGSIYSGLKFNKKILAIPRLEMYNEHVDNHQFEIINYLEEKELIKSFNDIESFLLALKSFDDKEPIYYKNYEENSITDFINNKYLFAK